MFRSACIFFSLEAKNKNKFAEMGLNILPLSHFIIHYSSYIWLDIHLSW
jgi:hypothetical protein